MASACAWARDAPDPEADDPGRRPADPLAHHEVVRDVGHDDFVLCLGYKGECIKDYFLNYNEALSNDFVLSNGGRDVELARAGTSRLAHRVRRHRAQSTIAERLLAVASHLDDDEYFLATYGDGLYGRAAFGHDRAPALVGEDRPLHLGPPRVQRARRARGRGRRRPVGRGHQQADVWINGGFMVLRRDILDTINPGEELVIEPFGRLIEQGELLAYRYEGFWEPMDTIKDKQRLDALAEGGNAPWQGGRPRRECDSGAG